MAEVTCWVGRYWAVIIWLGIITLFCVMALPAQNESSGLGMTITDTRSEVEKRNEERRLFVEKNPEVVVLSVEVVEFTNGDVFQYVVVEGSDHGRTRLKYDFDGRLHFLPEADEVPLLATGDECSTFLYDVYWGGSRPTEWE